jgi:hypothetical protein
LVDEFEPLRLCGWGMEKSVQVLPSSSESLRLIRNDELLVRVGSWQYPDRVIHLGLSLCTSAMLCSERTTVCEAQSCEYFVLS